MPTLETSENITAITFDETATPATPAASYNKLFFNTSRQLCFVDDAGDVVIILDNTPAVKELQFTPGSWFDGSNPPTATQTGDYPGEAFTINDSILVTFQIPQDCSLTVNLTIKLYWYCDENYALANGEVQWACAFSAVPSDETEAVDGAGYTGDLDPGDQNIPATAKYLTETTLGVLAYASLSADDIVGLEIERVNLDGGVDPTAEPIAVLLTVEYTSIARGS